MGLLDDAIRDHLELKRRHGASSDEVAQQEHEALGPVRRDAPDSSAGPDDDALDRSPFDGEDDELDLPDDPPLNVLEDAEEPEEPIYDEDLTGEPDAPPPPVERGAGAVRMGDVVPADEEPPGDDVLEETPDFLQETPEHDRLWFEQKPPKDFDF